MAGGSLERNLIFGFETQYGGAGAKEFNQDLDALTSKSGAASSSLVRQAEASDRLDISKRRLITSTAMATTGIANLTSGVGGMTGAFTSGEAAVGLLTHTFGSLIPGVGLAVLAIGSIGEGLLRYLKASENAKQITIDLSEAEKGLAGATAGADSELRKFLQGQIQTQSVSEATKKLQDELNKQGEKTQSIQEETNRLLREREALTAQLDQAKIVQSGIELADTEDRIGDRLGKVNRALADQPSKLADSTKAEIAFKAALDRIAQTGKTPDQLEKDEEEAEKKRETLRKKAEADAKAHSKMLTTIFEDRVKVFEKLQADEAKAEEKSDKDSFKSFMESSKAKTKLLDAAAEEYALKKKESNKELASLDKKESDDEKAAIREELAEKLKSLDTIRKAGLDTSDLEVQYKNIAAKKIEKVDEDVAKAKEEIDKKAAKALLAGAMSLAKEAERSGALSFKQAKLVRIAEATVNTASAVTSALATPPFPVGLALAAMAAASGLLQIRSIMRTEPGSGGSVDTPSTSKPSPIDLGQPTGPTTTPGETPGAGPTIPPGGPSVIHVHVQAIDPTSFTPTTQQRIGRLLVQAIQKQVVGQGGTL